MSYKEKLKDIKAFVFDVDGVFTDGSIFLMPGGSMCRAMNVLDGYAIMTAIEKGYKIGVITGGDDPMVEKRVKYLGIDFYYAKSKVKMKDYEDFKKKNNLKDEGILMMGDDIPDREVLKACHIGTCPANAVPEVKAVVDYISPIHGGSGAIRDVIEQVLKVQGKWDTDGEIRSI